MENKLNNKENSIYLKIKEIINNDSDFISLELQKEILEYFYEPETQISKKDIINIITDKDIDPSILEEIYKKECEKNSDSKDIISTIIESKNLKDDLYKKIWNDTKNKIKNEEYLSKDICDFILGFIKNPNYDEDVLKYIWKRVIREINIFGIKVENYKKKLRQYSTNFAGYEIEKKEIEKKIHYNNFFNNFFIELAKNKNTPSKILDEIFSNRDEPYHNINFYTLKKLAKNENISKNTIEEMLSILFKKKIESEKDEIEEELELEDNVFTGLMENPKLSSEKINKIMSIIENKEFEETDAKIVGGLLCNKNLPENLINKVINDENIFKKYNLNKDKIYKISNNLIENKNLSMTQLLQLFEKKENFYLNYEDFNDILENNETPSYILEQIWSCHIKIQEEDMCKYLEEISNIISNENTSKDVLEDIFKTISDNLELQNCQNNELLFIKFARNENTPTKILSYIYDNHKENVSINMAFLGNKNTPKEILEKIIKKRKRKHNDNETTYEDSRKKTYPKSNIANDSQEQKEEHNFEKLESLQRKISKIDDNCVIQLQ
ncbi:MAG TPA: hypothetical protein VLL98_04340 [Rickettsiales bacterium]|nr:hypothetical protein [Rickettsiales bacterium]